MSKVANLIEFRSLIDFYPLLFRDDILHSLLMTSLCISRTPSSFCFIQCGEHHLVEKDLSSCGGLIESIVANFFKLRISFVFPVYLWLYLPVQSTGTAMGKKGWEGGPVTRHGSRWTLLSPIPCFLALFYQNSCSACPCISATHCLSYYIYVYIYTFICMYPSH